MAKHPDAPCSGVKRSFVAATAAGVLSAGLYVAGTGTAEAAINCTAANTITANVVVLDNPTVFNRLGAQNPELDHLRAGTRCRFPRPECARDSRRGCGCEPPQRNSLHADNLHGG